VGIVMINYYFAILARGVWSLSPSWIQQHTMFISHTSWPILLNNTYDWLNVVDESRKRIRSVLWVMIMLFVCYSFCALARWQWCCNEMDCSFRGGAAEVEFHIIPPLSCSFSHLCCKILHKVDPVSNLL